ncbi:DUF692 domain-containing protein [Paraburkholderia bengalensis]|uniref:UPF0276 protein H3V53_28965 n=1 Tax=Paraburkholderia bengalensis TaxID=2747562 RepID=A0ABU8IZN9_9BURK
MTLFNSTSTSAEGRRLRFPTTEALELAGASFKPEHLSSILQEGAKGAFFEVHAENYMGDGGPPHRMLEAIRRDFPLSIHGVCMSIGGADELDALHLERFRQVLLRYEPEFVSEHLAWSSHGGNFFNDLLPLPYTSVTLERVCRHIEQVQEAIRRPILLENPSTYVTFRSSTMNETEFLHAVTERTGCGLLLDVNNVFVSATNHGYSPESYLNSFPFGRVGEVHLGGHTRQLDSEGAPLLIDSHNGLVSDEVWALYESILERIGPVATLVEWDSDLPAWSVLWSEVLATQTRLEYVAARELEEVRYAS